ARAAEPQELGDVLLDGNSFLADRLDDTWRETFWNALKEEDPTIDTLVEKYNMIYVDMLEQASQVEELVRDRIQGELLPVLHDSEDIPSYAS
ncbi:MAG: hypothetical protein SVU32_07020, partial [Candidatus Nanohaloarchaea archaeon]|nr:hypothetical protein [Candidatus Nanohaloarchaea archaeon]